MTQMTELETLLKQKEDLERRIRLLTDGTITLDEVKLAIIRHPAAQKDKWAVSFRYEHTAEYGWSREPKQTKKWVPIFACDNREEAVKRIPGAIKALQELYDKAVTAHDT